MKVHHLNCGTMHMPTAPLVCHVLLLETDRGLVLVDTGYGLRDIADPARRLGPYRRVVKPILDPDETALRQVERLGFRGDDVTHIIVTHFDSDHIGGIADFPDASIHTTAAEARGAMHSPSWREKVRYQSAQWAHGPKIVEHNPDGEKWRGFAAAKELDDISPGIVLVSLPGHTRGHMAVAVDSGDRWILHAGDSFYHPGTIDGTSKVPRALRVQEALIGFEPSTVRANHARLAELYRRAEPGLAIICAHDPSMFEQMRA
ncbi:MBL fold metallo-hydrolase [Antrihabitans stalactiti]|uniref:MBL fold metallo-hydrolase n=1 Tax=Antrihabitans stalactiti TaxID=2584121 RepID=A0A848KHW0_9NOCA|nr:MBL fold metallo-hydrolase [Antrihabitans stalactiti]NMN95477.1 MBL fold metallo-hydrolase [Antrihabitans stalactiti]